MGTKLYLSQCFEVFFSCHAFSLIHSILDPSSNVIYYIFFYEKNQFESSSAGVCSLLTLSWNSDIEKNTSESKIIFCVSMIVSDFGCVYTIYCLIVYLFVEMFTVTKNNSSYFFTLEKDNSYDFSAFSLTNNY